MKMTSLKTIATRTESQFKLGPGGGADTGQRLPGGMYSRSSRRNWNSRQPQYSRWLIESLKKKQEDRYLRISRPG